MSKNDPSPARILVVDDDDKARAFVARSLVRCGYEAAEAEGGHRAMEILQRGRFDAVVCDFHMPEVDGLDVLRFCAGLEPRPVFVMLTAHGSISVAVQAMKHGAVDFLVKPASVPELDAALKVALARRSPTPAGPSSTQGAAAQSGSSELVGSNAWLGPFSQLLEKVATSEAIVLIEGETGTGKSAVAREIWRRSQRTRGPFLELNCAAIAKDLMENELFGNVKGAFTGAVGQAGKVEKAKGGTLFLDEIGELQLDLQAKLLHLLQERTYTPVGSSTPRQADVRFIAATNRDLRIEVQGGRFRPDLYFRLDVVKLTIPPLRERVDDIPILIEHFREQARKSNGRVPRFPPETLDALCRHDWPGNVRELENLVLRLSVLLEDDEPAYVHHLPDHLRHATGAITGIYGTTGERLGSPVSVSVRDEGPPTDTIVMPAEPQLDSIAEEGLAMAVKQYESNIIRKALLETGDNVTQAASLLRMKRTTLIEKRRRYQDMGLL